MDWLASTRLQSSAWRLERAAIEIGVGSHSGMGFKVALTEDSCKPAHEVDGRETQFHEETVQFSRVELGFCVGGSGARSGFDGVQGSVKNPRT